MPRCECAAPKVYAKGTLSADRDVETSALRGMTARVLDAAATVVPSLLRLQGGLDRPRSGYGIGMSMDNLPRIVFTSEYGRHAKRNWRDLIGIARLQPGPLDLDDVRHIPGRILRDSLGCDRLALSNQGSCTLQGVLNLIPATDRRPQRVGEGYIVAPREQLLLRLRVSRHERVNRSVVLLNHLNKVRRQRLVPPWSRLHPYSRGSLHSMLPAGRLGLRIRCSVHGSS